MKKKSYISFLVFMLIMCETFVSCSKDGDESNSITLTSKDYKPYTFSGDSIEYGYFDGVTYYRVTSEENKTLEVSRSVQESTFVKIPQNVIIDGIKHEVTSIRRGAFGFNYCNLIILPNSVTSIGDWAFGNCWSLTSLNIPERVTSIGDYAFFYCI